MNLNRTHLTVLAGFSAVALVAGGILGGRLVAPDASAAVNASATVQVVAPAAPQPLNVPFTVSDNLASFVPSVSSPTWAGWDLELLYDPSILRVDGSGTGGLCPPQVWAGFRSLDNPAVYKTGCAFQSSTATGAMDLLTVECIADGNSPLTLLPSGDPRATFGTSLFDVQAAAIPTTLVGTSVTCSAGATVTPTGSPTPTNTPTGAQATQTAVATAATAVPTATGLGDATIAVSAPAGAQPLNMPFTVTDSLTSFVGGTSAAWSGWQLVLAYDNNILEVDQVVKGDLCTPGAWANPSRQPNVETGCLAQLSTSPGVMDVITVRCIAAGTSPLTLLPDSNNYGYNTFLFDRATYHFSMTLVSTSVTCAAPVAMVKSDNPNTAPTTSGQLINLFLNKTCGPNNDQLCPLNVYEWALNVGGDPDGVGAFEFQLKYDNHLFDINIAATNWLYATGRVPGATGIGGCAATIITENDIRFGCVSKNPVDGSGNPIITTGNKANGVIANITVTPKADLVNRITPGNDNGAIRTLLDEGCEFADIWGHPLSTNQLDSLGREILLPGVGPGGVITDCADITITVRILEGDMNLDCQVTVADDQIEASHYGAFFGNLLYQPWYDLEPWLKDGDVDIKDLQKVFGRNGSTCAAPVPAQPPLPEPVDP